MNRNVLIGCGGVIVIVVVLVGALILETPRFIEQGKSFVQRAIAEEQRVAAIEAAWQPPSASVDGQWFPAEVGERRLQQSAPVTGIPELGIERAGYHGTYRSSVGNVEVDILPATDLERAPLIKLAEDALSNRRTAASAEAGGVTISMNRSSSRLTTTRGNRTTVRIGSDDFTRFWWVKGTLFIFRARGAADSETFPEEFLRAISPGAPAPATKIEKE
jgi:hypothetical protein